jgi:hypothetical protein
LARLPGWAVLHGGADGLIAPPTTGGEIVTEVWADGQRVLDVDVLVDARGWGPLDLSGFPPPGRRPAGDEHRPRPGRRRPPRRRRSPAGSCHCRRPQGVRRGAARPALLPVVRDRLDDTAVTELIETIVRAGGTDGVGIGQGSPQSPVLLNLYLDAVLDRPWAEAFPDVPLIRWIDDVLLLCPTRQDAEITLRVLTRMLDEAMMPLKSDPPPTVSDLGNGESVGRRTCSTDSRRRG